MQKEKNRLNKRQYIKDLEKLSLFYTTKTREEEGKECLPGNENVETGESKHTVLFISSCSRCCSTFK